MKVLIIGPFPPPINGCSYANKILISNLEKKFIHPTIIDTNTSENKSTHGRFSVLKVLTFLKAYKGISKIFSADIIYTTPGQTFFGITKYAPFFLLCILLKKPYIIHNHGNYLGQEYTGLTGIKRKVFHYLISKSAAGIVLSASLENNFFDLLPREKIFVVENFVEETLYQNGIHKKNDLLRIIYLSNLMREKGIFELLGALLILKEKGIKFKAIIAGSVEDELKYKIEAELSAIGESVKYIGTISGIEKKQKLEDANVFILPTHYKMEGQPISLLEGMATGNIIITTRHAGIPDVVSNENGFLIAKGSSAAIAHCLEEINQQLPAMVATFSDSNRKYAAENFTERRFTDKILEVLYATAKT